MKKTKVVVDCIPDAEAAGGDDGGADLNVTQKKPMAHYKEVPVTAEMAEGTRAFAEQYNAMRAALIENKLMKSK